MLYRDIQSSLQGAKSDLLPLTIRGVNGVTRSGIISSSSFEAWVCDFANMISNFAGSFTYEWSESWVGAYGSGFFGLIMNTGAIKTVGASRLSNTYGFVDDTAISSGDLLNNLQFAQPSNYFGDVVQIVGGDNHFLARRSDGTVFGWGSNSLGQLKIPQPLPNRAQGIVDGTNAIFVVNQRKIWGRGENTVTNLIANAPEEGVTSFAVSRYHGLALLDDGRLKTWGQSTTTGAITSTTVSLSPPDTILVGTVNKVYASNYFRLNFNDAEYNNPGKTEFSCVLKNDGTVVCWGNNSYGQCLGTDENGNPITDDPKGESVKILGQKLGNITKLALGNRHVLALKSDGTIVYWGQSPTGPSIDQPATDIAAAHNTNIVLLRDDTIVASTIAHDGVQSLVDNIPSGKFLQISARGNLALALDYVGKVKQWGDTTETGGLEG